MTSEKPLFPQQEIVLEGEVGKPQTISVEVLPYQKRLGNENTIVTLRNADGTKVGHIIGELGKDERGKTFFTVCFSHNFTNPQSAFSQNPEILGTPHLKKMMSTVIPRLMANGIEVWYSDTESDMSPGEKKVYQSLATNPTLEVTFNTEKRRFVVTKK